MVVGDVHWESWSDLCVWGCKGELNISIGIDRLQRINELMVMVKLGHPSATRHASDRLPHSPRRLDDDSARLVWP